MFQQLSQIVSNLDVPNLLNTKVSRRMDLNIKGREILFIDDDYVNYLYFKELLTGSDTVIHRATSLDQAFQKLITCKEIAVIIISALISEKNDCKQATKLIKSIYPDIPLIAILDEKGKNDANEFVKAGCDSCLNRHTDSSHFKETLNILYKIDRFSDSSQYN